MNPLLPSPGRLAAPALLALAVAGCVSREPEPPTSSPPSPAAEPERAPTQAEPGVQRFATDACRTPTLPPSRAATGRVWETTPWGPPTATPIRLLDLDGDIAGAAPPAAAPLAAFSASDLAAWEQLPDPSFRRIRSPSFAEPLAGVDVARVRVKSQVDALLGLVPSPDAVLSAHDRALRDTLVPVIATSDGKAGTVDVRIGEVLSGNLGDARGQQRRLHWIELAVPLDVAPQVVLEGLELYGEDLLNGTSAAGRRALTLDGERHPAWFAHAGSRVGFDVDVPGGGATLRWYDAGTEGSQRRVVVRGRGPDLVGSSTQLQHWQAQALDLASFAGQRVRIELQVHGEGLGWFGAPQVVPTADRGHAPDVIVYMIDTLRADHLGAWGSSVANVSPNLDKLAAQGTAFVNASSTSSWTKPAIPSLMTGLYPTTHRVGAHSVADLLPSSVPVLQERLRDAGWRTGSFAASPLGSTLSGLDRGFETAMLPQHWKGELGTALSPTASSLHRAFFDWVAEEPDRPYLAYIHTMEVHAWADAEVAHEGDNDPYDVAVHSADERLRELVGWIMNDGRSRQTLLVVLSDHGESRGDHGVWYHGSSLYQSQVHVPLLFWAPGVVPAQVTQQPVSLADVTPTVLQLLGLPALADVDGRSQAVVLLSPERATPREPILASRLNDPLSPDSPRLFALVDDTGRKVIRQGKLALPGDGPEAYSEAATWLSFDLASDQCEEYGRTEAPTELRELLDRQLLDQARRAEDFAAKHGGTAPVRVEGAELRSLKALGYVE